MFAQDAFVPGRLNAADISYKPRAVTAGLMHQINRLLFEQSF
jgi:hypothetical protein